MNARFVIENEELLRRKNEVVLLIYCKVQTELNLTENVMPFNFLIIKDDWNK